MDSRQVQSWRPSWCQTNEENDVNDGPVASAKLKNNLRVFITPTFEMVITDDRGRRVDLPEQISWELAKQISTISKTFEDVISEKTVNYKSHLGANFYVAMQSPFWLVRIQRWFMNEDKVLKPGKGIALKIGEWKALVEFLEGQRVFDDFKPCYNEHYNQLSMLDCLTCTPNGWMK